MSSLNSFFFHGSFSRHVGWMGAVAEWGWNSTHSAEVCWIFFSITLHNHTPALVSSLNSFLFFSWQFSKACRMNGCRAWMGLNNIPAPSIQPHSTYFYNFNSKWIALNEWKLRRNNQKIIHLPYYINTKLISWCMSVYMRGWLGLNNILVLSIQPSSVEWTKFHSHSATTPIHATCPGFHTFWDSSGNLYHVKTYIIEFIFIILQMNISLCDMLPAPIDQQQCITTTK